MTKYVLGRWGKMSDENRYKQRISALEDRLSNITAEPALDQVRVRGLVTMFEDEWSDFYTDILGENTRRAPCYDTILAALYFIDDRFSELNLPKTL